MDVSENSGTPKSSILYNRVFHYKPSFFGFSPIFGNPQMDLQIKRSNLQLQHLFPVLSPTKNGSCGVEKSPQKIGQTLVKYGFWWFRKSGDKTSWGWYFIPLFTRLYTSLVVQDLHQQCVWLAKTHCKTTLFALVRFWCKYLEHNLRFAGGNLKLLGSNHIESSRMRSGTNHHLYHPKKTPQKVQ